MKQVEKLLIAVSQRSVILAEEAICGCARCDRRAYVPFARILEKLMDHPPGNVDYVLPVLGRCPGCCSSLDEGTLVLPKKRRSSLT